MDVVCAADCMAEGGMSALQAENETLKFKLQEVREAVKSLTTSLFKIHPDDLQV